MAGPTRYDADARLEVVDCRLGQNEHGFYCVPAESAHRPAAQHVLSGQVWEQETLDLVAGLGSGADVITAGAYFGDLLPAISATVGEGARVWSVEPNPVSFSCAQWTLRLNRVTNVVLVHAALGERAGTAELHVRDPGGVAFGGGSTLVDDLAAAAARNRAKAKPARGARRLTARMRGSATVTVDVVAIDDLVPADRAVSVIHLDVEGFEAQALAGAAKTIARCAPAIVLESVPRDTPAWRMLADLGYDVVDQVGANIVLRA